MKYFFLILFVIYTSILYSQNNANIWYFGDRAGVDFNSGTPVALTDGQLDTQEGVATICNQQGDFLFYTDGSTVWDKNHNTMPNGTGLFGHWSSTSSALIVPNLSDTNLYYIFTVDELGGSNGLCYTLVNMLLPGNGSVSNPLGDIVINEKNIQLITPVAEKITAVLSPNQQNYGVITHGWNNNNFYAYAVTSSGVSTTPIISSVGNIHSGGSGNINAVGYMKASPNKDKIALVNRNNLSIDVYDYDNATGIVSNEVSIDCSSLLLYGIEFSKTGQYLFIGGENEIKRYEISTGIIDNVLIDDMTIFNPANSCIRAMQLGPDENIYVSVRYHNCLCVISNPEATIPELTANGVFLDTDYTGRNCRFGLPTLFYYKGWEVGGIKENNLSNKFLLYPNPTTGKIYLSDKEIKSIKIYDIAGQLICYENFNYTDKISFDISNNSNGIYFLKVETKEKTYFSKIVKQ